MQSNPRYLLLALNWLKQYPTLSNLAGSFNVTEKTAGVWAHYYVKKIQALKTTKIRWLFDNPERYGETFILSVDGVHCRICEPRNDPSAKWYSKKFNASGFAYEVGVAIFHDQICWVNGPFPCGKNDMSIFNDKLANLIPNGKLCIADLGYRGAEDKVTYRNTFDNPVVKEFKRRACARQETVNCRLKTFHILENRFRTNGPVNLTREEKHQMVFEACAVILQIELDNGHALFTV